jgi:hypothetical protein
VAIRFALGLCTLWTSTRCEQGRMSTPVVTIFVRHSLDCRYKGDEFNKRCRCSKHLRWSHNGKQHRRSAKAHSWAEAEVAKRRVEEQFKPANERTKSAIEHETIQQAIDLFVSFKTSEGTRRQCPEKVHSRTESIASVHG